MKILHITEMYPSTTQDSENEDVQTKDTVDDSPEVEEGEAFENVKDGEARARRGCVP
jgi:hypothetical protein